MHRHADDNNCCAHGEARACVALQQSSGRPTCGMWRPATHDMTACPEHALWLFLEFRSATHVAVSAQRNLANFRSNHLTHSPSACPAQAALQLSDEQAEAVCCEYMAMIEHCHAVYSEQQDLLSGLAEFRRPSADPTGDPVRAGPAASLPGGLPRASVLAHDREPTVSRTQHVTREFLQRSRVFS